MMNPMRWAAGLVPVLAMAAAAEPVRTLADLAAPGTPAVYRGNDATVTPVPSAALRVETQARARWPGIEFPAGGTAWNLLPFDRIEVGVRNPGREPLTVNLRVDDASSNRSNRWISGHAEIPAGGEGVLTARLSAMPVRPSRPLNLVGMRGAPGENTKIDLSAVTRILVFVGEPRAQRTFEVTRVEARGSVKVVDADRFLPFIDAFGQFVHADWPGKVRGTNDLAARLDAENADLAANPEPPGRNRFGGWDAGPALAPAKHFRTEKRDGRWWMVDPDGRLFWSFGADCVRADSSTPVTDREAYFAWLPERDSAFGAFFSKGNGAAHGYYEKKWGYRTFDFSRANLLRKHGDGWAAAWVDLAHRRLRSWGLNTVANWSDAVVCAARRTPYTANASFSSRTIAGSEGYWGQFPDPYDPSFREGIRRAMEKQKAAGAVGDPWCIGFFVHNELGWGRETSLSTAALRSPPDQPAKVVLVDAVRQAYGTIGALNEAWGTRHASWEALLACTNAPDAKAAKADLEKLYSRIADEYFRVLREEVKRAAPDQMYFGCRFAWVNDLAVKAAAPHCDAISFNKYDYSVEKLKLPEGVDRPVVIGEFHFGALDRGMFHTGLKATTDQDDRAAKFKAYLESALRHPNLVGAHWFQYRDQATTGRSDGENYQIGLVDICDTPYPETIAAARAVGAEMYALRAGARAPSARAP
jgi:hypothetical protein